MAITKPTQMASESFTLQSVFGRAEVLCNQEKKNVVKRESLLQVIRRKVIEVPLFADDVMAPFFTTEDTVTITEESSRKYVLTHDRGLRSVLAIVTDDLSQLVPGDDGVYSEAESREFFTRLRRNIEYETLGRFYYLLLGHRTSKRIELFHGSAITNTSVLLTYRRNPYVDFTLADVDEGTQYIDAPDFTVSWIETSSAVTALEQENVEVSKGLRDDVKGAASAIQGVILQERERLRQRSKDQES